MGGRSAVGLALALWAGLLAGERMHDVVLGASAIAVALAAGIAGIRARRGTAAALIYMAFLLAGAARGSAFHARLERESTALRAEDTFWLDGTIDSPPALESGSPLVTLAIEAARPPLIEGSRVRLRLPDDCAVEWGDHARLLARLSRLELKPSQNQLQVDFVGLDYEPGEVLRYSYKLEGADSDWNPSRAQHAVNYAALSGGKYRFT